jgi:hypothetical protein
MFFTFETDVDKENKPHYTISTSAWMVKLVDTLVSGTSARKGVEVRVLFQAQQKLH